MDSRETEKNYRSRPMISEADATVGEWAVVIHFQDAAATDAAVVCQRRFESIAVMAPSESACDHVNENKVQSRRRQRGAHDTRHNIAHIHVV